MSVETRLADPVTNERVLGILNSAGDRKLAAWWGEINRGKYPWDLLPEIPRDAAEEWWRVMDEIVARVGMKLCNRIANYDMTDEEHEAWWEKNGEWVTGGRKE